MLVIKDEDCAVVFQCVLRRCLFAGCFFGFVRGKYFMIQTALLFNRNPELLMPHPTEYAIRNDFIGHRCRCMQNAHYKNGQFDNGTDVV